MYLWFLTVRFMCNRAASFFQKKTLLIRLMGLVVLKHVIHQRWTNPSWRQHGHLKPSGIRCRTLDEICYVICVGAAVRGIWSQHLTAGLTALDWALFIYNRAVENGFVPDGIFIDWNMLTPAENDWFGELGSQLCAWEVKVPSELNGKKEQKEK